MKKLINTAFFYAVSGMVGGVFYREFTKFNGYVDQRTSLAFVHLHLFALGMLFFMVVALLDSKFELSCHKRFRLFFNIYNTGLLITAATFIWRGVMQVLGTPISKAVSASISGIAGIGHTLAGAGIIILFTMLRQLAANYTPNRDKHPQPAQS